MGCYQSFLPMKHIPRGKGVIKKVRVIAFVHELSVFLHVFGYLTF